MFKVSPTEKLMLLQKKKYVWTNDMRNFTQIQIWRHQKYIIFDWQIV